MEFLKDQKKVRKMTLGARQAFCSKAKKREERLVEDMMFKEKSD